MKRFFSIILVFSIMLSYYIPAHAAENIDGITVALRGTESTVTIDSENAHSGKSSLKITKTSPE